MCECRETYEETGSKNFVCYCFRCKQPQQLAVFVSGISRTLSHTWAASLSRGQLEWPESFGLSGAGGKKTGWGPRTCGIRCKQKAKKIECFDSEIERTCGIIIAQFLEHIDRKKDATSNFSRYWAFLKKKFQMSIHYNGFSEIPGFPNEKYRRNIFLSAVKAFTNFQQSHTLNKC